MLHVVVCFCAFIMMWYFQLPRFKKKNPVLWDFSLMLLYMNTYCIKMLLYKKNVCLIALAKSFHLHRVSATILSLIKLNLLLSGDENAVQL